MENCPICDTKLTKDYCTTCAWEIFTYLGQMTQEEKDRYADRFRIWSEIYLKSNNPKIELKEHKNIITIDGLMWQDIDFESVGEMNWDKAQEYAKNLRLGGYDDWRLPTRDELRSLGNIELYKWKNYNTWDKWFQENNNKRLKNSKEDYHFIRKEFLENMPKYSWFWSGEKDITQAWVVYFYDGNGYWNNKTNSYFVRCVR